MDYSDAQVEHSKHRTRITEACLHIIEESRILIYRHSSPKYEDNTKKLNNTMQDNHNMVQIRANAYSGENRTEELAAYLVSSFQREFRKFDDQSNASDSNNVCNEHN